MTGEEENLLVLDTEQLRQKLDGTVFLAIALAAVVIPLCHTLLHRYVITPAGKRWLKIRSGKKTDDPQEGKFTKLLKFQESAWKCFAYTAIAAGSARALSQETYWRDTREFWTGCEVGHVPCTYEPSPAIRFAYALDMAYYLYAIPYCILFETKRKDFWATMMHHVATVILIGYSYALGFTRVGVVIMFLHDVCDPALEMAKMAKYAGQEHLTNALFGLFTLLWIGMRDVYFPLWVIWSVLFEAYGAVVGMGRKTSFPHWELFSGLLIFLWVLHVYWTWVILRIAVQALFSGSTTDDREDDDDD